MWSQIFIFCIQKDKNQNFKLDVLQALKQDTTPIQVVIDLASRGLDISNMN